MTQKLFLHTSSVLLAAALMVGCNHSGGGRDIAPPPAPAAAVPGTGVRFIVFGDSQFANMGVYERMVHEANLLRPDFVIQVGDMIQGYTYSEEQARGEWAQFRRQIAPLTMPFMPVPGNHDVVTTATHNVYGEVWGKDRYYYSFDVGPVHCVVLNSYWPGEGDRIAEWQRAWLASDLEAYAARHGGVGSKQLATRSIFVYVHAPLWRYAADHPGRKDWEAVHAILRQYPTRLVVGGHTHEYVWENRDGIDYIVINSSGGMPQQNERGGFFHAFLHVSAQPDGDVRYGVVKAGSVLPLDTVNSEERRTVTRHHIAGSTIRLLDWTPGAPLDVTVTHEVANPLGEERLYRLDWVVPEGVELKAEPAGQWLRLAAGERKALQFRLTAPVAPGPGALPHLRVSATDRLRSGAVSREWEAKYREAGPGATNIALDAPVDFTSRSEIFLPPVATARRATTTVTIDGRFDEPVWQEAAIIDDFRAGSSKPPVGTSVRLLWDDGGLYVAARMEEPNPAGLKASAGGKIPFTWDDDDFELSFDTDNTQSAYTRLFQNVAGTRFSSRPRNWEESTRYFQAKYQSAIHVGEDHWALEMYLPWEDMTAGQPPTPGTKWSFNMARNRPQSSPKEFNWSASIYNPARYGVLLFE